MDPIQALISLISGGLAGAAVNAIIASRKQKLDVTLSVVKDFFGYYENIGKTKGIFGELNIKKTLDIQANLFMLRQVGDWFHYVASLISENTVLFEFLNKVGVVKELKSFRENISAAKGRCPEYLENVWLWWPNLENFNRS
jgi:hypothetical protein